MVLGFMVLGDFKNRGHDIDEVGDRRNQASRRFNPCRPVGDHWCADSTLVIKLLEHSKRGVGRVGPAVAITLVGVFRTWHDGRKISGTHRATVTRFFRQVITFAILPVFHVATAIVDRKKDQCVFQFSRFLECLDDLANSTIHGGYLSSVDFHSPLLP